MQTGGCEEGPEARVRARERAVGDVDVVARLGARHALLDDDESVGEEVRGAATEEGGEVVVGEVAGNPLHPHGGERFVADRREGLQRDLVHSAHTARFERVGRNLEERAAHLEQLHLLEALEQDGGRDAADAGAAIESNSLRQGVASSELIDERERAL
eukprot:CAMPEP_0183341448 /NCGR_PEP_ID=MMETSP0164_2-20130417/7709_1 /TAXON_ID=221442 /ORGANISM="Coccolithus pelagicus ssp braarudi, Strain PLY182g" /LENGTH=157 /DNA_ID=CAMNT_0025511771 /DNA_START=324 /DNA_END=794 /DNA_ORIENTATION=-